MSGYKKPNGAPSKPEVEASNPRFQIASRLGALKDTALLSDPFPTSARFTIRRKGSRAHQEWNRKYLDSDAFSSAYLEQLFTGEEALVLTEEEVKARDLLNDRKGEAIGTPLESPISVVLSALDRLTRTAAERDVNKRAIRSAVQSGHSSYSKVLSAGKDKELEEAVFLLARWEDMPGQDDDGNEIIIPYTEQAARDLLTNDTPLEGCGLDELILSVPVWCLPRVDDARPTTAGAVSPPVMIPRLTLGQAYILWVHDRAEQLALFRDQVLETAGKNSPPSSDSSTLSGDGTSLDAPVAESFPV